MTGPIPINPVSIHPQFAATQQPQAPGLELLLQALQHRQELGIAKQKLTQAQQELELHKRIAGPEIAGQELENLKRKADLRDREDDLKAKDQALQLYTGNLPRLHDAQGIGEVIAGIKDPLVASHFYEFLKSGIGITQAQSSADLTGQQVIGARQTNAADVATRDILGKADLTSEAGQRAAIRGVLQTAGPDEGAKIAQALNAGAGRYGHVVGPDGFLYITDSKTGAVRRDTVVGQRQGIGQVRLEAIKRSAATIVDLLDAQQEIVKGSGLEGSRNPVIAQMLADARVLGVSGTAAANLFRSDPQQATNMLKTRFTHNYIGMLANARSSTPILENLSESYWPVGVSDAVLRRANQDRQRLRAIMVGVRDGRITDLTRIPGFSASAAAAAAEGQNVPMPSAGPTAPPNPDQFYKP